MASVRKFRGVLYFSFLTFFFFFTSLLSQGDTVEMTGESVSGEPGQIVCVNFTVNNFDSIAGFQFSVNFEADLIDFEIVNTNGVLTGFNGVDRFANCEAPGAWGPPHCTNEGTFVNSLWTTNDFIAGNSLPDGTVLFEICFRIKDDAVPGQCADININAQGVASSEEEIEIFDPNLEMVEVVLTNGEICITPPASAITQADILTTCPSDLGQNNGSLALIIYGGTPPYNVSNVNTGTMTSLTNSGDIYNQDNLAPGDYAIQILDNSGGSLSFPITIDNGNSIQLNETIDDPSCSNFDNGSIELSVQGGTPFSGGLYKFEWSNSLIEFTDIGEATNLANGNYSVTVTDSLGCSIFETFEVLVEELGVSTSSVNPNCEGTLGTITIEASGGSGSYSASLLGVPFQSNFNFTNTTTFSNLEPGTYFIGLEDNQTNNCMIQDTIVLAFQNSLIIDPQITNADCETQSANYEIALSNSDGTVSTSFDYQVVDLDGPNIFEIGVTDPGSNVITLTNVPLSPSGYEITVLSSEGCESVDTLPSAIASGILTLDQDPIITSACLGESNGSIAIDVTSGSAVTMTFSTGQIFNGNSIIVADFDTGMYSVVIANEDGCQLTIPFEILPNSFAITSATNNSIACTDAMGDITADVQGGVGPFDFVWDHPNNDNTATLSGVPAGASYTVTVTDQSSGCSSSSSLSLNASDAITLDISNLNTPDCFNSPNGSIEARVIGGSANTGSFTYEWSDGTLETISSNQSAFLFNLNAGSYWVIGNDGQCTSDTFFFDLQDGPRYQFDVANSTIDPPSCEGQNSFVFIEVTPPTPGTSFTYSFPELGIIDSPSPSQSTLGTGDIVIEITASNGCSSLDTFTITPANSLTASVDSVASVFPVCADDEFATLVIDVNGGSGMYSFNWSGASSISNTASDLGIGTYSVTVSDDEGCSAEVNNINIFIPPPISATVESLDPACVGDLGGFYVTEVMGGSGEGYSFQVNTDPTTNIADTAGVFPGNYTVRVYDSEGCNFESQSITIAQPSVLEVILEANNNEVTLGSEVDLSATIISSGIDLQPIQWNPEEGLEFTSANNTDATAFPIQDQVYQVTVTDINGCTASDELLIQVNESVSIYIPNVFRQDLNETSENRFMKIYAGTSILSIDNVQIYDRWGSVINEVRNLAPNIQGTIVWDGTLKAKEANSGVYIYRVAYTLLTGQSGILLGDVTLLR